MNAYNKSSRLTDWMRNDLSVAASAAPALALMRSLQVMKVANYHNWSPLWCASVRQSSFFLSCSVSDCVQFSIGCQHSQHICRELTYGTRGAHISTMQGYTNKHSGGGGGGGENNEQQFWLSYTLALTLSVAAVSNRHCRWLLTYSLLLLLLLLCSEFCIVFASFTGLSGHVWCLCRVSLCVCAFALVTSMKYTAGKGHFDWQAKYAHAHTVWTQQQKSIPRIAQFKSLLLIRFVVGDRKNTF